MAWSKFTPGSMEPAHLSAMGLFRGTASGAAVTGEDLFGPVLHLTRLLVSHCLMMDSLVVIYERVRDWGS